MKRHGCAQLTKIDFEKTICGSICDRFRNSDEQIENTYTEDTC